MTLSATALTTVAKAKSFLGISDLSPQYLASGLTIYCDATDATAATVAVNDGTIVLVITGGTSAATVSTSLTAAASDTLSELATVLEAVAGWTCDLVGNGSAASDDLRIIPATSALGAAQMLTLQYSDLTRLELIIEGISDRIEKWLDRGILSQSYSEIYPIPHYGNLTLRQPDVSGITRIAIDTLETMRVKYTGADTMASVEVTATAVIIRSRFDESPTTTTSTFENNGQVSDLVTAINAVSGWVATQVNQYPSHLLVRQGPQNAKNRDVQIVGWQDWDDEYQTDYDIGSINFPCFVNGYWSSGASANRMLVDYTAGQSSIPADVELTVLEMVAEEYNTQGEMSGVQSESLGDYSYSTGSGSSSITTQVADRQIWQDRLAKWRRVTV